MVGARQTNPRPQETHQGLELTTPEAVIPRVCKLPNPSKKPHTARVFMCGKVRHVYNGKPMSRFDIWHKGGVMARCYRRSQCGGEENDESVQSGDASASSPSKRDCPTPEAATAN
ncbi:hypothetical protein PHMEG_0001579 [Phytophthora megakarya]|uniref:Uncharacterized protein n=1 Tax=Phytophthora megakarya TaxID=4795 RepID=A0A225X1A3_9STRA|nr:hypothetical protein PHMEG_0001579 [Phytophthora megakarya]